MGSQGGNRPPTSNNIQRFFIPASSPTAPTSRMSLSLAVIRKHVKVPENVQFLMKVQSLHFLEHSESFGVYFLFFGTTW